jgi:hypothetical protein
MGYCPGTLWEVSHEPESHRYKYVIIDGPYAYISRSSKEMRLTTRAKIMYTIEGRSLYIIDENGKSQKTRYLRKDRLKPPPPPVP